MLLYESSKVTSPLYYAKVKKEAKEVIHNKGGSGLINVCRVASSANYPGHEVFYLKPTPSVWDVIQGAFLIRKANGKATYDDGRDVFPLNMDLFNFEQTGSPRLPSVMFGAQNIHNELLKLIKT
ncbi:MAG: hypothetical protein NT030_02180 [Candidatus Saganbacteria bacterium]|nr:hypothetical protein [Candidatus Saganbacteria bacterium]